MKNIFSTNDYNSRRGQKLTLFLALISGAITLALLIVYYILFINGVSPFGKLVGYNVWALIFVTIGLISAYLCHLALSVFESKILMDIGGSISLVSSFFGLLIVFIVYTVKAYDMNNPDPMASNPFVGSLLFFPFFYFCINSITDGVMNKKYATYYPRLIGLGSAPVVSYLIPILVYYIARLPLEYPMDITVMVIILALLIILLIVTAVYLVRYYELGGTDRLRFIDSLADFFKAIPKFFKALFSKKGNRENGNFKIHKNNNLPRLPEHVLQNKIDGNLNHIITFEKICRVYCNVGSNHTITIYGDIKMKTTLSRSTVERDYENWKHDAVQKALDSLANQYNEADYNNLEINDLINLS